MDEEVKRKRREREQQAREQQAREQQALEQRKMETRHLATLFSHSPILNKSLVESLAQNQFSKQKLSQSVKQRTQSGNVSQLPRVKPLPESTLQQPSQTMPLQSSQRNPCQSQQRTHNSWPSIPTTSTNHHGLLSGPANLLASNLQSQFHPQSFLSLFQPMKNACLPLHPNTSSSSLSSNPLDEILDLTVSSPSPSPDTSEGGPSLDSLTRHSSAFGDNFNLEALISQPAANPQPAAQLQQSLLPQQQQQQQQQNHNMMANNHQDVFELFDLPLCPQMSMQKANPSSSTSSGSSSTSPVSNSLVSKVPPGLPPSSSSSLFSSPSSSSLFSSPFSSPYLHPQSDPLHLPNGHCSSTALDVREALNSMLQDGPDRKSVIQYRHQD